MDSPWIIHGHNPGKIGKNPECAGVGGFLKLKITISFFLVGFWAFFMVTLWKRYGQKLRRIILLHFGLITFRFGYMRERKLLTSMISGF